jgi:hypothetical protein
VFGHVKQHISSLLVINAIKKTNTANGHFISFVLIFFIGKGGNTASWFSITILQYPAYGFAKTERLVFFWVKDLINVFIQRPDIVRVVVFFV